MLRASEPRQGLRRGPRPLLMHLALAALRSSGSPDAWPSSSDDWMRLIAGLGGAGGTLAAPDAALVHGIACYRRHPWSRALSDPPVVWAEGEARLLDFGGGGPAPPLLLVPSLINRASILDLTAERSMARHLAASGLRVLLLDWGWPDAAAMGWDLEALITGRLARAVAHVAKAGPVTLVGYCMGGLLTVAAAQLQPDAVAGLAVLATPWDFHAGAPGTGPAMARLLETVEPVMAMGGTMPIDALQLLFSVGDPHGVGDKYRGFGRTVQDSDRARQFVAFEDWLNDGVPLAAPIARQCLRDWYGENAAMRGAWRVAGQAIVPARLRLPCFVAIPGRDRIVPPESALPLATLLRGATVVRPAAGHVGMVAGASAARELWGPLAAWARAIQPGFRPKRRARKVGA